MNGYEGVSLGVSDTPIIEYGMSIFSLQYPKKYFQTRRIIKIAATRCHILKLKCTKFDFGWGSVPDPAKEVYSAPPDRPPS